MGRIQVLVAAALLAFAGLAIAGGSAGAQVGNLDKSCKKGYVLVAGPGTQYDTDGNGFVCVDPTTGDIRDDKGQFVNQAGIAPSGPAADENGDAFVCYDERCLHRRRHQLWPAHVSAWVPAGPGVLRALVGVGPEQVVQLGEPNCRGLAAEGAVLAHEVVAPKPSRNYS